MAVFKKSPSDRVQEVLIAVFKKSPRGSVQEESQRQH